MREDCLNTAVVRFSNVYGSTKDHHDRVIPAFCFAAATGQPLKVEGSQNTFDFTHVSDVVAGTLKIIEKLINGENSLAPFHLTTGRATSLIKAAKLANVAGGNNSEIIEAPSRTFDVSNFYGDSSQTMDSLNWKPTISIEEGIKQLVFLFEENLHISSKFEKSYERRASQ
jgi:nucleoside-diphosphate-sugar epimerase